jgi:hypothetical protein
LPQSSRHSGGCGPSPSASVVHARKTHRCARFSGRNGNNGLQRSLGGSSLVSSKLRRFPHSNAFHTRGKLLSILFINRLTFRVSFRSIKNITRRFRFTFRRCIPQRGRAFFIPFILLYVARVFDISYPAPLHRPSNIHILSYPYLTIPNYDISLTTSRSHWLRNIFLLYHTTNHRSLWDFSSHGKYSAHYRSQLYWCTRPLLFALSFFDP